MPACPRPRTPKAMRPKYSLQRWRTPALIGAAVAALLVASPLASATYAVEASPPFAGVEPLLSTTISTVGCHSWGEFPLPPRVNATSGFVHERLRAGARFCAGGTAGYNYDYADVTSFPGFYGPNFTVPATGSYTATYEWVFSYHASLNASGPGTSASAIVSIFIYDFLFDGTNSTILSGNGGGGVALFHELHEGSWTGGSAHLVVKLENGFTLVTGHLYYFETVLLTSAEAIANGAGSAYASLNLGSHGDRARLVALDLVSS